MAKPVIERQIDAAIAGWVKQGLVTASGWKGQPLLATPLPKGRDICFDPVAVERVLKFFQMLHQQIGRWAGHEFTLLDWQVRHLIAPVFGIKYRSTGLRVIRTVWFEIPRKNGKSSTCSGLSLYLFMADREPGAQVFAAAGDKAQAGIVFRASAAMAKGSKPIRDALGKGIQRSLLEYSKTGSIYRVLSADGARQHGLNVHGAIIDEVHVHKTPDLVDALETGTGSREQPLVIFITTADDGIDGSIYAVKREYLEGIVGGHIQDRTFFGVVFGVDDKAEGFDPFSDETLAAANPGAGVTVLWDYLRAKAAEAKQSPAQLNRYLRLHLNVRTKQETRWLTLDSWVTAGGNAQVEEKWRGRTAWGGLDLSKTTDLSAFVLISPDSDLGGYDLLPLFWVPQERVEELERRLNVPLSRWAAEGWLRLTEGNVVDYAQIRADMTALVERLGVGVECVGYDPWNATETVLRLTDEGWNMVPVGQTYAKLTAACKELERLVVGSTDAAPLLRHGQHPVLRWMADCVTVRQDQDGNIKPIKPDLRKSSKRIDGIAALVNALSQAIVDAGEVDVFGSYMTALAAKHAEQAG